MGSIVLYACILILPLVFLRLFLIVQIRIDTKVISIIISNISLDREIAMFEPVAEPYPSQIPIARPIMIRRVAFTFTGNRWILDKLCLKFVLFNRP